MGFFDFLKSKKEEEYDLVFLTIDKKMVESGDIDTILKVFQKALLPENIHSSSNKFEIVFDGYNFDRRELFEIPEVKAYIEALDRRCPFWFYLLSFEGKGLWAITYALTDTVKKPNGMISTTMDSLRNFYFSHKASLMRLAEIRGIPDGKVNEILINATKYYNP